MLPILNIDLQSTWVAICLFTLSSVAIAEVDLNRYKADYQKGNYQSVITDLESFQIENFTPQHFEIYIASLSRIDLDEAEAAADLAIATFSDNADMYLIHASIMGDQASDSIFSALGYAEKALNSLEKATQLEPNQPKYLNGLMSFYLMAPSIAGGDKDKALEIANKIAKLDEVKGIAAMTSYYTAVDEFDSGLTTIQKGIEKHPTEITLYVQLANLYLQQDNHVKAIETYAEATKIVPSDLSNTPIPSEQSKQRHEDNVSALYISHYQIGRIALLGDVMHQQGIQHLATYIGLYESTEEGLDGLPSVNWAYLRQAGLLMANKQPLKAQTALSMVNTKESDRLASIHKKLSKKVKRAIKKLS